MIIADEPTSALDKKNADIVFDLLYKIAHEQNKMVVIATHDPNIYGRADNIFSIEDKRYILIRLRISQVLHKMKKSFLL